MILTAHQPVYLPWLGLFHKIALADLFVLYDHVQFQTDGWNHRNRIKTATGLQWLTVEVAQRDHLSKSLIETQIIDQKPWRKKHLRSIEQNYARAPYFKRYIDFFVDTYSRPWTSLVDLNLHQLTWLLEALGIGVPIRRASTMGLQRVKSDMALDMCQKVGADLLIFGVQGRDYADRDAFATANIKIVFQDYQHPVYPQLYGDFVSHLSVVDLLFNCGPSSLDILMSGNITKADLYRQAA